jgi:hypothetical protein
MPVKEALKLLNLFVRDLALAQLAPGAFPDGNIRFDGMRVHPS